MLLSLFDKKLSRLSPREISGRDGFFAREEFDCVPSMNVKIAKERIFPAGKREIGGRRGDADIHPHHADFDLTAIFPHCSAVFGEDGSAITARIAIHDGDRLLKS